jgi:hypothetical protein
MRGQKAVRVTVWVPVGGDVELGEEPKLIARHASVFHVSQTEAVRS